MHKTNSRHWLQTEIDQWHALLDEVGAARPDQPGVAGDWSVKDLVVHLAGWHSHLTLRLMAAQLGNPEPSPPCWPSHRWAERQYRMTVLWGHLLWQQFGAALDMLANALQACPDDHWRDAIWADPTDAPEYTEFWFIGAHTLVWLDRYVSGTPAGFAPPPPLLAGRLPAQPYTRAELLAYLAYLRGKSQAIFEGLTEAQANQVCQFPWGEPVSFAELQLYSMRHVQEHAAQLSLHLGRTVGAAPDWVARADDRPA